MKNTLDTLNALVEDINNANKASELLGELFSILGPYAWMDKEGNIIARGNQYDIERFHNTWDKVKNFFEFDDSE